MDRCYTGWMIETFRKFSQGRVRLLSHDLFDLFYVFICQDRSSSRRRFVDDPSFILINLHPSIERRLADRENGQRILYGQFPLEDGMSSCGTDFRSFSFHAWIIPTLAKN